MTINTDNTNKTDNTDIKHILIEVPLVVPIVKKRGRKSKKDIEALKAEAEAEEIAKLAQNINVIIHENSLENGNENGKGENKNINCILNYGESNDLPENEIINDVFLFDKIEKLDDDKPLPKKRGRKPKGGKIIQQTISINKDKDFRPNVILHLKCSLKDLQQNLLNDEIQSFNFSNTVQQLSFDIIQDKKNGYTKKQDHSCNIEEEDTDDDTVKKDCDIREIWKKLKNLEHNLHTNNICDKKSACFWCTCDFDNPPIYIPKHYIKDAFDVYGCFCSPECATAFLMNEHIDSSCKFERYHLLNNIYAKIYDYNKKIKPAPNPFYMLEKYYGNLSIQEYRSLLRNERLFLVVDKPLTRVMPELHEDNDDFIINNKIIPSNTYQIKKRLQKKNTKNNILNEQFGLN